MTDDAPPAASTDPMNLPSMPPMATPGSSEPDQDTQAAAEPPATPKPEATRETPPKAATTPTPAARDADSHFSGEDVVRSTEQFLSMLRGLGDARRYAADRLRGGHRAAGRRRRVARGESGRDRRRAQRRAAANPIPAVAAAGRFPHRLDRPLRTPFRLAPAPGPGPRLDRDAGRAGRPPGRDCRLARDHGHRHGLHGHRLGPAPDGHGAGRQRVAGGYGRRKRHNGGRARHRHRAEELVRPLGRRCRHPGGRSAALSQAGKCHGRHGREPASCPRRRPSAPSGASSRRHRSASAWIASRRGSGGLVNLQTTPERPVMGSVNIRAENSILCTVTGDDPLFRIEGQDTLESLRDRIRWEAHKVAYHRIKTYRRDEIVQAGGLPRIYDRDDWTRAFRPTDDSPMLSDLTFRHQADASSPAWKLERNDLRTRSNSTSAPIGPDADKVPEPPADEEPCARFTVGLRTRRTPSSALRAPSPRRGEGDGGRLRRAASAWRDDRAVALAPTGRGRGEGGVAHAQSDRKALTQGSNGPRGVPAAGC